MHPWIWINEPQHGTAIAAVASTISTLAAITAGAFAYRAYFQAKRQADLAEQQTQIARRAATFERDRAESERLLSLQEKENTFEQRKAEEDAIRPRFRMTVSSSYTGARVDLTNEGLTAATNVMVWNEEVLMIARAHVVSPDARLQFDVDTLGGVFDHCRINFTTTLGSIWVVNVTNRAGFATEEQVINVVRRYEPYLRPGVRS